MTNIHIDTHAHAHTHTNAYIYKHTYNTRERHAHTMYFECCRFTFISKCWLADKHSRPTFNCNTADQHLTALKTTSTNYCLLQLWWKKLMRVGFLNGLL